jgi:nitrilase
MKKIRVAALQMNSKPDKSKNYDEVTKQMKSIRKGSLDLLTLPEVFPFCGTEDADLRSAEPYQNHGAIDFLSEIAREKGCYIAGGTVAVTVPHSDKIRNRTVFIDPKGEIVSYYDKIHLFDVDFSKGRSFKESRYIEPGRRIVVSKTPFGKIGFAICYDLRFPELFRRLAMRGAEIIVVPAAFISKTGPHHWETLLRARAIENQVYIVATNQVGSHSPTRHTYGGSVIIDPWGDVITRAKTYTPDIKAKQKAELIRATLDPKKLNEVRSNMQCLKNARLL